ncbi:LacI family transcriptional regulator [Sulfitobacter sp. D35]|uniref:LacI family transcriptional regulator n=1 Tax=Sulfitobacter sp. D35 TaxID=3083252 RepID=UPI00296F2735|nr:LacI family transcriptional regulator [Sulfitobacter sp. D35]MDW4496436.1 LacI family transcriptional regulator [Sulfitobacter sp. D35]
MNDSPGDPSTTARPTLKTIAYMTGLGVTTVSRALSDAPDISQSTKERVRLVANQIGYRPNRAGVRLRTGKTNVISLILSIETEVLGLTSHLVYGLSERLRASPYHLIVTPYSVDDNSLDPVRYIVETGSADGVVFSRIEPRDARVQYLHERGFPFATHGRSTMGIDHAFFDYDNQAYGETAVRLLAERGRRRLALLPPPAHLTYATHMLVGFTSGLARHDLLEVPLHQVTSDSPHEKIMSVITEMMTSPNRPDGIVCASASSAIAVISAAEDAGLVIGRDFDVAVKDAFNMMRKFRREVIVLHEDFRAAGLGLADAVLRLIDGENATGQQIIQPPRPG